MAASVMSDTRFEIAEKRIEVERKTYLISIVHSGQQGPHDYLINDDDDDDDGDDDDDDDDGGDGHLVGGDGVVDTWVQ